MRENDEELAAMVARFRAMVVDWRLTPIDVAALLKVDREDLGLDLVPYDVGPAEHRMRLLLQIAPLLEHVVGRSEPWCWLRAYDQSFDPESITPLELMSGPVENLRALRAVLRTYA